ncbi:hypothetical protein [Parvibaculum sp.]|uniref:hypothetical protein n=1 Tax=Parvibaculum sp. TaxID=2024848 RepID=UPI002735DBCE|nr:hypothetical protein [Parvibaculum sp.]MDP3329394.1 hypothetical protein [Parvibaculum sp.]
MSDLVDVVAVARRILGGGVREETGVSNMEVRALCRAVLDMRLRLDYGARAVITIDRLADDVSPDGRVAASQALDTFAGILKEVGLLERRHDTTPA